MKQMEFSWERGKMSEKEKPKRSTRMGFLRSCLIFSLYPLLILTIFVLGLVYWAFGGYVKPSLDTEYIPTAEYLLEHPIGMPNVEADNFTILISFSRISMGNQICFRALLDTMQDFDNLMWAEIYINEQVVSRLNLEWIVVVEVEPLSAPICIDGYLDTGLHIIEFRVKENLFAEPYYIQRWAIEIP
jgi:hypothetical protein